MSGLLSNFKRRIRRVGHQLRLWDDWEKLTSHRNSPGEEKGPEYYDKMFVDHPNYVVPYYKSSYYATWCVVADRLRRAGTWRILDIGCGPGQFAEMIVDSVESYTGVDFSRTAIEQAQARVQSPKATFLIGDVADTATLSGIDYNAVICMEILEHIEDDISVVQSLQPGVRCLFTVPNFPYRSHVRHFDSEEHVRARYEAFFDKFDVITIKGTRNRGEKFYLFEGICRLPITVQAPAGHYLSAHERSPLSNSSDT